MDGRHTAPTERGFVHDIVVDQGKIVEKLGMAVANCQGILFDGAKEFVAHEAKYGADPFPSQPRGSK